MRIAIAGRVTLLVTLLIGGCVDSSSSDPGWDPQPGGPPVGGFCQQDSDCPGQVCARDGSCLSASDVYTVHVSWTLRGQPASATTCAAANDLVVDFGGFGFAPVPCSEGKFSVDKLPVFYSQVSVFREDSASPGGATAEIPRDTGLVAVDLPY